MINAGVIGATGYAGSELVRLLLQHPKINVKLLASRSYIGQKIDEIYEYFKNFCSLECTESDIEAIADETDVIFLALPHGIASEQVTEDILKKTRVIDLGADFRLKSKKIYEKWYKIEHHAESLLEKAVYGLCEWNRKNIKESNLVANPGCYPTCGILPLAPLLKEGIIKEEGIIIDAKSGVSGAGRSVNLGTHFTECSGTTKAYKVASHRHTPEIEESLSKISGKDIKLTFVPHLVPMNRGILSTCYGKLNKHFNYKDIKKIYEKYYKDEFFIRLTKKGINPETKWVKGSNFCDIGFTIDERTNNIIAISAIDNMVKGAAGQAVQNMNIMFGFEETAGLKAIPIFPV
ncbi:MAG: N-acetyl-gamma-glutamyl-phosphate reductase [Promethearchaeota archaeon]